jgi:hypothetical protein
MDEEAGRERRMCNRMGKQEVEAGNVSRNWKRKWKRKLE